MPGEALRRGPRRWALPRRWWVVVPVAACLVIGAFFLLLGCCRRRRKSNVMVGAAHPPAYAGGYPPSGAAPPRHSLPDSGPPQPPQQGYPPPQNNEFPMQVLPSTRQPVHSSSSSGNEACFGTPLHGAPALTCIFEISFPSLLGASPRQLQCHFLTVPSNACTIHLLARLLACRQAWQHG